jgi:7-carboxy-7-deazaguanine synthase
LVVHEIYRSIQGEGTHAGLPCIFVRLTACHLRCGYCDSAHAFQKGEYRTSDDVIARIESLGGRLLQITGGEPLLQPEVLPLMTRLADAGYRILLETSGSLDIAPVDPRVRVILDVKTPGSGEVESNLWENLRRLKSIDEVKFVVCDRDDFVWAAEQIKRHDLLQTCPVLVSPARGRVEPAELAEWILDSGLPVRMQLQLHAIIWGPTTRGV